MLCVSFFTKSQPHISIYPQNMHHRNCTGEAPVRISASTHPSTTCESKGLFYYFCPQRFFLPINFSLSMGKTAGIFDTAFVSIIYNDNWFGINILAILPYDARSYVLFVLSFLLFTFSAECFLFCKKKRCQTAHHCVLHVNVNCSFVVLLL